MTFILLDNIASYLAYWHAAENWQNGLPDDIATSSTFSSDIYEHILNMINFV